MKRKHFHFYDNTKFSTYSNNPDFQLYGTNNSLNQATKY